MVQPCIKWWGEPACNLINALKTVKMDNERAKSQMAQAVCLLGTLTAYWSAGESLRQGQSSDTAGGTGTGQQQPGSIRKQIYSWANNINLLLKIGKVVEHVDSHFSPRRWETFLIQYSTQPSATWNWRDVMLPTVTIIAPRLWKCPTPVIE